MYIIVLGFNLCNLRDVIHKHFFYAGVLSVVTEHDSAQVLQVSWMMTLTFDI